jgi:hypothetical protein
MQDFWIWVPTKIVFDETALDSLVEGSVFQKKEHNRNGLGCIEKAI